MIKTIRIAGLVLGAALLLPAAKPLEKTLKEGASFPMGVAVNAKVFDKGFEGKKYNTLLKNEFNSLTAENLMKMKALRPAVSEFDFKQADELADFAAKNSMRLHGHVLVWHSSLPDWVKALDGDSAKLETAMRRHINSTISHFKGKVASWDVVNEALSDTAGGQRMGSIWRRNLGPGYVKRAFRYAREADRTIPLFYNEYGIERDKAKLEALLAMVAEFKKEGVPIDGIGLQLHTDLQQDPQELQTCLRKLANTGLLVHISELDVCVNGRVDKGAGVEALSPQLANQQADAYQFIASAYFNSVPRKQRHGITLWNLSDADSWIPPFYKKKDWPCIFDEKLRKKPAYYGLLKGLK